MSEPIIVLLHVKTVSEANHRTHWRNRQKRAKQQRDAAGWALMPKRPRLHLPATVTITRIAPGTLDSDNLQSAMKAIRDGIADAFIVDDRDERYTWRYKQERGKDYRVRIAIETAEVPA